MTSYFHSNPLNIPLLAARPRMGLYIELPPQVVTWLMVAASFEWVKQPDFGHGNFYTVAV